MKLSVIIPTLNEEIALPALLQTLAREESVAEVLVVDGGSTDRTCQIARDHGARVLVAPRGRGQQLRFGADKATGDVLWFLHADTVPQPGSGAAIVCALQRNAYVPGGNFRVLFEGPSDFAAWLTGFYAWLRKHGLYYGDSAIFVRRNIYDQLGGVPATALMEDYEFIRKLEKTGLTLNITEFSVTTSSRRFENRKPWRIVMQWIALHGMYYCRVSGERLAQIYQSQTHVPAKPGRDASRSKQ